MTKFISNSNVYKMAEDVKSYVENNKKYLYKGTYGGIEFTWNEMQDIMTYVLLNLKSNVNAGTYKWCNNAHGDTINENIYKEDYLDQARRVHEYIIKNGQVPNNVTTTKSKKRVQIDHFTYCVAKILVWYKNHGQLPSYCLYNSEDMKQKEKEKDCESPFISSPHYTNQGAGQLGQINPYTCGPHNIHQALKKFGVTSISESTLASYCGTTSAGTSHAGIESGIAKAAKVAGIKLKCEWKNFKDLGKNDTERFKAFGKLICQKNVFAFFHLWYSGGGSYIDDNDACGHYEGVNKVNIGTGYVKAMNSLGSRCSYPGYCGHLQDRKFSIQTHYIQGISQKSVCIITKV